MVEKEAQPEIHHYDRVRERKSEMVRMRQEGKRVVKFDDIPWDQSRQALIKVYSNVWLEPGLAAPGWNVFMQRIDKHSGRHIHQGGLAIYIVDGKGYSIVDGVRYNWQGGDLLILPIKPGGCDHQHFNEDPDTPSHWIAIIFVPWREYVPDQSKQLETHPDWKGK